MHLQNLSIVIITLSVIILAVNSNTAFWMPPVALAGNFSRETDVSGFMKTRLAIETCFFCGGYYVAMTICKILDPS